LFSALSALPKTFLPVERWVGYLGQPVVQESFALSRFCQFFTVRGRSAGIIPFLFYSRVAPKDKLKRIGLDLVSIVRASTILFAARLLGGKSSLVAARAAVTLPK